MWLKLAQMALQNKTIRNMLIGFVGIVIAMMILMVTNLQKTLCSIPIINKADFCQEDFHPIPDEKFKEIADAIQKMRDKAVDDNNGIGEKFETRQSKYEKATTNEAEVYLRALINLDMAVLNDADVNEKNLDANKFDGTNLQEMWKVVKKMQASDDYKDVQKQAKKNGWKEKEWLQYVQMRVYTCYLIGDEVDMQDGWFKSWLKSIVGMDHPPCEELNSLLGRQYVQGGGAFETHKFPNGVEKKLIDHGDIGVVGQKVSIYEYYEYCDPINKNGNQNEGDSAFAGNKAYAETKDRTVESTRNDCGPDTVKKNNGIQERQELAYLTKMNIVEGFEKYSLYQQTANGPVPKGDESFKDKLHETVAEVYDDMIDGGASAGMGSVFNGWLIPLEEGTYYRSSPYGARDGAFHYGTDLASLQRKGIPIYAAADGVVEFANANDESPIGSDPVNNRESSGCSGRIVIRHTNGWMTTYCHILRPDILVQTGWKVKQGQIIAATGNGGGVEPHLHFEMCPPVPSYVQCSGAASQVDSENYEGAKLVYNKDAGKLDNALIAKRQQEFQEWKQKIAALGNKSEEEVSKLLVSLSPMSTMAGGGKEPFGVLSAYFETGGFGRPDYCVNADGDYGGLSCGTWQFTHYKQKDFTDAMKRWGEIELYNILSQGTPGDEGSFKPAWKRAAALVGNQKFLQLQKRLVAETYFQDAIQFTKAQLGVNLTERSYALQEAMLSLSVQHGAGGATSVLHNAFGGPQPDKDDAYFINGMYTERQKTYIYFKHSSSSIQQSVKRRFIYEQCIDNSFLQNPGLGNSLAQGQTACPDTR